MTHGPWDAQAEQPRASQCAGNGPTPVTLSLRKEGCLKVEIGTEEILSPKVFFQYNPYFLKQNAENPELSDTRGLTTLIMIKPSNTVAWKKICFTLYDVNIYQNITCTHNYA